MRIVLNDADVRLAKYIGTCRYENARNNGIDNLKMGNQSNQLTDENGMGGEIAVCKYLNCYPDTAIVLDLPNFDLIYRGMKIDAKTTTHPTGRLLATLKTKRGDADIYALVTGELPEYTLAGWATESELLQDSNISDLGHGRGYCLTQSRLRPIESLKDPKRAATLPVDTGITPPWEELYKMLENR